MKLQPGRFTSAVCRITAVLLLAASTFAQTDVKQAVSPDSFTRDIRPLLARFCNDCHTGDEAEAEIDLASFSEIGQLQQQTRVWQKVAAILETRQMPPKEADQPREDERALLEKWVRSFLLAEAEAHAGDPGPVTLRRLSNAEYTYTIRDLTGIDTLDPVQEFPVDGAAGEGFTNTGDALVMSPALIQKYLAAAKDIAGHAVLTPDGIRFSKFSTERDWTDERLADIQRFYAKYTDTGGGKKIEMHGLTFDTDQGGRLPLDQYLQASVLRRDAPEQYIAAGHELNAKYFSMLWQALSEQGESNSFLMNRLRALWQEAKPGDVTELANEIRRWQAGVWKFNVVGHVGRDGTASLWMEPNSMLQPRQEFRIQLPQDSSGEDVLVYFAAHAIDPASECQVVWRNARLEGDNPTSDTDVAAVFKNAAGLQRFHDGNLTSTAPAVIKFRLPRELAAGRTLVVTAEVASPTNAAQFEVSLQAPNTEGIVSARPIVAKENSAAFQRLEAELDEFRQLFPPALCYARIVPIDEVVTLTLYFREDDHLQRLMLNEREIAELDRMWDELLYVAQEPLKYEVAFEQLREFATQDRPDHVIGWQVHVDRTKKRIANFRQRLLDTEHVHLQAVVDLAKKAWRKPLTEDDEHRIRDTHTRLRDTGLTHEEAIRLTIARVLTAPSFLYRLESPGTNAYAAAVSNHELATRLSYFLWSSMPDEELLLLAREGTLADDETLVAQAKRLLTDTRVRRMAIHFACQWLDIRDFDKNNQKNEKLYPNFANLRSDMYEESVQFFSDMFRNDGSILDMLDADHTFLNEKLAAHYGISGVEGTWQKYSDVRRAGRGGVLGMATVLAHSSGASRTSPILRGNWVSETLLGERLPRPPADVPQLPEEVPTDLTERELIERHSSAPECAECHVRIDPYGFALEQYDAIGRLRSNKVDTKTELFDGHAINGMRGLSNYLSKERRDDFIHQFCKKLLGYAIGREVQLSDEPLLVDIKRKLVANEFRFHVAVEEIVKSPQFRNIRGKAQTTE